MARSDDHPRRVIFGAARSGLARALLYAVMGYAGVLALGWLTSSRVSGGDSFADLGLAALTIRVLAPLAGLIGAAIALAPYRRRNLSRDLASLFWSTVAIVLGVSGFAFLWLDIPSGFTTLLVGSTALVIMRVALIERQAEHQRRRQ